MVPDARADVLLRPVRKLLAVRDAHASPDEQLLRRFVTNSEEVAFAALVERHGPLVLGVCRRVLGHEQDAEDAFQATFLVLARRAASIRQPESLPSWLHGVACRISAKARASAARRRRHERQLPEQSAITPADAFTWVELRSALDEELQRLPEKYRAPLVLCYLDGRTQDEAASDLGWTPGAVRGRLERGRRLLRARLTRRGLTLSAALVTAALGEETATATVPAPLSAAATESALSFVAGKGTPARVVMLAERGLRGMTLARLKPGIVLPAAGVVIAGAGLLASRVRVRLLSETKEMQSAESGPARASCTASRPCRRRPFPSVRFRPPSARCRRAPPLFAPSRPFFPLVNRQSPGNAARGVPLRCVKRPRPPAARAARASRGPAA
jgi:RNA polymerase sigma factor (sigma-70 family)